MPKTVVSQKYTRKTSYRALIDSYMSLLGIPPKTKGRDEATLWLAWVRAERKHRNSHKQIHRSWLRRELKWSMERIKRVYNNLVDRGYIIDGKPVFVKSISEPDSYLTIMKMVRIIYMDFATLNFGRRRLENGESGAIEKER